MQDQLEQYIISHKSQLDVFEPDDRLWERIDTDLNQDAGAKLNLEQFIVANKNQLDVFEPNDRLWERIDQTLNGAKVQQFNFWAHSWKLAAAIAFLVAAGALLWWVSLQAPRNQMADSGTIQETDLQSLYTAEMVEVETYYTQQITAQKARIESFRDQGIVLDEALYEQMELLGSNYFELQRELLQTEDENLIVNAMIQNLMMQMELLNQQLLILEDIKNKQIQYGTQKQS